jgi:mono/diheme cytochrome c family protein
MMAATRLFARAVTAGAILSFVPGAVLAKAPKIDLGKSEYASNCAVCHGIAGKGDGTYNQTLKHPANLTLLAKENKGVFPYQRVWAIIDGREQIEAHGTRDMPIWGAYYRAIDGANRSGSYNPEPYVRAKITSLIDYIGRLQAK